MIYAPNLMPVSIVAGEPFKAFAIAKIASAFA
jgi:hypothetical protein